MVSPILNEKLIIDLLKTPAGNDGAMRIQHGAVYALVDVHDRKATREEFTTMAEVCLALYAQSAKLWVLNNIEEAFNQGGVNANSFANAREELINVMRKQSEAVIDIVKRLQECPENEDKIH